MEFAIGDEITVDRYNPIGQEVKTKVLRYDPLFTPDNPWYVVRIGGIEIKVRGGSIVESKDYNPVPPEERHNGRPCLM